MRVFVIAIMAAACLFANEAAAVHIQKISQQSAESMCKDHGGGTNCNYCDPQHCHSVECTKKGGCTNLVYPQRQGSTHGGPGSNTGATSGTLGNKSGGNPPPKTVIESHPVSGGAKH
jgi:hypothetical protein